MYQWWVNTLWPSDAKWRQRSWSTLVQVMACYLMAPSHYLNQCWLYITEVLWQSSESNFTASTQAATVFWGMSLKILVPTLLSDLPEVNELITFLLTFHHVSMTRLLTFFQWAEPVVVSTATSIGKLETFLNISIIMPTHEKPTTRTHIHMQRADFWSKMETYLQSIYKNWPNFPISTHWPLRNVTIIWIAWFWNTFQWLIIGLFPVGLLSS